MKRIIQLFASNFDAKRHKFTSFGQTVPAPGVPAFVVVQRQARLQRGFKDSLDILFRQRDIGILKPFIYGNVVGHFVYALRADTQLA